MADNEPENVMPEELDAIPVTQPAEQKKTALSDMMRKMSQPITSSPGDLILVDTSFTRYKSEVEKILSYQKKTFISPMSSGIDSAVNITEVASITNQPQFAQAVSLNFRALAFKVDTLSSELSFRVKEIRLMEKGLNKQAELLVKANLTYNKTFNESVNKQLKAVQSRFEDLETSFEWLRRKGQEDQERAEVDSREPIFSNRKHQAAKKTRPKHKGKAEGGLFSLMGLAKDAEEVAAGNIILKMLGWATPAIAGVAIAGLIYESGFLGQFWSKYGTNIEKSLLGMVKGSAAGAWKWIVDDFEGKHKTLNDDIVRGNALIQATGDKIIKEIYSEAKNVTSSIIGRLSGPAAIAENDAYNKARESQYKDASKQQPTPGVPEFDLRKFASPQAIAESKAYNDKIGGSGKYNNKPTPGVPEIALPGVTINQSHRNGRGHPSSFYHKAQLAPMASDSGLGEEEVAQQHFKNWIEGPTPWGNVAPSIGAITGGMARGSGSSGGAYNVPGQSAPRYGGRSSGRTQAIPQVPSLPGIASGGLASVGVLTANNRGKVDPKATYLRAVELFRNSPLNGFVPQDGAKWGVIHGTPEEWAHVAVGVIQQESSFYTGSTGDGGNSAGLTQMNNGEYGIKNVQDPDQALQGLVNQWGQYIPKAGSISGSGVGGKAQGVYQGRKGASAYFGSMRGDPTQPGTHAYNEAGKYLRKDANGLSWVDRQIGDAALKSRSLYGLPGTAKIFGAYGRDQSFLASSQSYRKGMDANKSLSMFSSDRRTQLIDPSGANRPTHYFADIKYGDRTYHGGTGGMYGDQSLPYGDFALSQTTRGQRGYGWNAFNIGSSPFDPKLGRERPGVELHGPIGTTDDKLLSEGCMAIAGKDWPELHARVLKDLQEGKTVTLHVHPGTDGHVQASIDYNRLAPGEVSSPSKASAMLQNNPSVKEHSTGGSPSQVIAQTMKGGQMTPNKIKQIASRLRVSNSECVSLVKAWTSTQGVHASEWVANPNITAKNSPPGTALATVPGGGDMRYAHGTGGVGGINRDHALIKTGDIKDPQGNWIGFTAVEQYNGSGGPREKSYYTNGQGEHNANAYYGMQAEVRGKMVQIQRSDVQQVQASSPERHIFFGQGLERVENQMGRSPEQIYQDAVKLGAANGYKVDKLVYPPGHPKAGQEIPGEDHQAQLAAMHKAAQDGDVGGIFFSAAGYAQAHLSQEDKNKLSSYYKVIGAPGGIGAPGSALAKKVGHVNLVKYLADQATPSSSGAPHRHGHNHQFYQGGPNHGQGPTMARASKRVHITHDHAFYKTPISHTQVGQNGAIVGGMSPAHLQRLHVAAIMEARPPLPNTRISTGVGPAGGIVGGQIIHTPLPPPTTAQMNHFLNPGQGSKETNKTMMKMHGIPEHGAKTQQKKIDNSVAQSKHIPDGNPARSDRADTSQGGPGDNGTGAADSVCFV